eukprot:sb/3471959/
MDNPPILPPLPGMEPPPIVGGGDYPLPPEPYPIQRYGGGGGGGHYNGGRGGGYNSGYNDRYNDRNDRNDRNGGWHGNRNRNRGYRGDQDQDNWDHRPRNRRPCAYFNTPQGCRSGANCKFIHEVRGEDNRGGSFNNNSHWEEREERRSAVHLQPTVTEPIKEPETLPEPQDTMT